MPEDAPFKACPMCGTRWASIEELVLDPTVQLLGYQARADRPEEGVLALLHSVEGCRTTLALEARELLPLYGGPRHEELLYGTERCRKYCLAESSLEECDQPCGMAWVRRAMQYLRRHELPGAEASGGLPTQ